MKIRKQLRSRRVSKAMFITALPIEATAVVSNLIEVKELRLGGGFYERGGFFSRNVQWDVLVAEIGVGDDNAAAETSQALLAFQPDVALFVGIAGGIRNVQLGDVVAANRVYAYESGRQVRTLHTRPNAPESSRTLVQAARSTARRQDWIQRIPHRTNQVAPRAFVAPIAAGEKVITRSDTDVVKLIRSSYNDAIAVEMEGHGFLRAVHGYEKAQAIVVRGISDLLDDKDTEHDAQWQPRAAFHAAAFAFELLARLGMSDGSRTLSNTEEVGDQASVVIIRLNEDFAHFTQDRRELLRFALAKFLSIEVEQVEVIDAASGSVKVAVRIPTVSAAHLLAVSPALLSTRLTGFHVTQITELANESAWTTTEQDEPDDPPNQYIHLECIGEFETFGCAPLIKHIQEAIDHGVPRCVIDLHQVKFINSTALGALVKAHRMLASNGGRLVLVRLSAFCREVIDKVGISKIVAIADTIDQALVRLFMPAEPERAPPTPEEGALVFVPVDSDLLQRYLPAAVSDPAMLGKARIRKLDSRSLTFSWTGGATYLAPLQLVDLLRVGSELDVQFQIPLLSKARIQTRVRIEQVVPDTDKVVVWANFVQLPASSQQLIDQFVKDMEFLKGELLRGSAQIPPA